MLERPDLSDDAIAGCLHDNYRIQASAITFLPIGYDATAWVFRVESADGTPYFLKTKSVTPDAASLAAPHFLAEIGVPGIVAPLATVSGGLCAPLAAGFTAVLYPFIDGRMGAAGGMLPEQWVHLGQAVRRIHQATPPPALAAQMRREPFAPLKGDLAWSLHEEVARTRYEHPVRQECAAFWMERRAEIEAIFRRAEELGRLAQARQPEIVLCHADIHVWNVLVDRRGRLHIVDWDETILAPRERDLMHQVESARPSGPVDADEALFRQGYGPVEIDPVILAYYRYEWVVQEIAEFGKQVLRSDEGGEITRQDGLRHFRALFAPGDVVESAYRSDGLV